MKPEYWFENSVVMTKVERIKALGEALVELCSAWHFPIIGNYRLNMNYPIIIERLEPRKWYQLRAKYRDVLAYPGRYVPVKLIFEEEVFFLLDDFIVALENLVAIKQDEVQLDKDKIRQDKEYIDTLVKL